MNQTKSLTNKISGHYLVDDSREVTSSSETARTSTSYGLITDRKCDVLTDILAPSYLSNR